MTDIYVHNDSNADSSIFSKLTLLIVINYRYYIIDDLYTH